jgi:hypothetical protein
MILAGLCLSAACSKIDYSHDAVGTGTIMTDYRMGDHQTSEAFGVVRGTGDVIDKYFFSTNNSSEIRVEDQFVLTKTAEKAVAMSIQPHLPPWPGGHGSYRLIGESWAKNIMIASPRSSQTYRSLQAKTTSTSIPNAINGTETGGELKFRASSQDGIVAEAATSVSDPENVDVDASLAVGRLNDNTSFDYQASWFNSSNVSIRSLVGKPEAILYEDDGKYQATAPVSRG